MRIETLAAHAGQHPDPATGAVVSPPVLSTTFEREVDGSYPHGYVYTRHGNPTRAALETCLLELEGGVAAAAFSSGSAVVMSILQALAPGDHVVAPDDTYTGTRQLLSDALATWGLQTTFVDMSDLACVRRAIQPNTRLVWLETPSNPLLKITDIAAVTQIAHQAGAISVCDNTFATPVLQHPFALGVDLIMHSTTKYLNGHSDVLGGAVIAKAEDEFFGKICKIQQIGGAVPSPFDCWLVLRGIRTLPYRVRAQSENALRIARFLSQHPWVEQVHYPGLETHPGHDIAAQQMEHFGAMLSFQVHGGRDEAVAVAAQTRVFTRATSLGGTESLIEHRASIEGSGTRTPQNLLRLSIGLEHVEDLSPDLEQALQHLIHP